jgi:hypothetical protein
MLKYHNLFRYKEATKMKNLGAVAVVVVMLFSLSVTGSAGEKRGTAAEAEAMVKKAITYI